jgi:predicted anti-sigma-YlaC factor YlaD
LLPILFTTVLCSGCSIRQYGVDLAAEALAEQSAVFASDDDPELIRDAAPLSLKLVESLVAARPEQKNLLAAAARGFTQYAYAFVQQDADRAEDQDIAEAYRLRERARNLYRRARDYGLRGLGVDHPDFLSAIRTDTATAVGGLAADDVGLAYWTAAAWAGWIGLAKDDTNAVADLPAVLALLDRALALDETFGNGAIHSLLITLEPNRPGKAGQSAVKSREHFNRAVSLTGGKHAGPHLALAEAVALPAQDRKAFESSLRSALAIDPNGRPELRLENLVLQRRARWLLDRIDKLFLE